MAKIILFGNQKGGVGKSQCTTLLATALASAPFNLRVLVVDTDKQQSIFRLRAINNAEYENVLDPKTGEKIKFPFDVISCTAKKFVQDVETDTYDDNYDVVFCDVAGKLDDDMPTNLQEISPVLAVADWCIVPAVDGNHNTAATSEFLNFATRVFEFRKDSAYPLSIAVFANMQKGKSLADDLQNELNAMSQQLPHVRFMNSGLRQYAKFSKGDTVASEYKPNSIAPQSVNLTEWVDEIYDMCGLGEEIEV